jgi:5-methylcytosine-specific restriction protein B
MGSKSIRHKNSYKLNEVNISASIVEDLIEFHKLIGNQVRSILINQSCKFWLYAPGEKARKWDEFYASGQFAIGWDDLGLLTAYETKDDIEKALIAGDSNAKRKYNDALACYEFASVVQPGDIIIAKKGKREYVGWGVVTGDYFYDDAQEEYKNRRPIDWKTNGEWLDDAGDIVTKTLTDITKYPNYVERLSKLLKIELNATASENIYMEYPLNTILYGPPGTGKTYNTILRSAEIIENRKIDSYVEALKIFKDNLHNRIEFITFHQNYSYEDFIQGLRPETDNKSSLTFDKKDGIFKKIAEKALENLILSEKAPEELTNEALFDNALEIFKEVVEESDANYPINETAYIMEVEEDAFRYTGAKWTNHANGLRMKFSDLKEFYKNEVKNRKDIKHLSNISGTAGQHKTYYFLVYEKIIKLLPKKIVAPLKVERKNYVIIIDEINRANISRVFGELITLIEPDKRSHGEIPLEAKLPSGDNFIVPSNLYIIGTMNTADKSIALLDIALRRRFEFEAMYPKYEIEGKEIFDVDILKKINEQIIKSKGHDFQIGHSYFMDENRDLIQRMNKKVIPLLLEYYMNDEKEVKGILFNAGLQVEENSWPIRITGKRA